MRKQHTLGEKILDTLKGYAKTQLLLGAIVTTVTWIILTLLDVRFPLILAVMTGAFSAVPMFGITIAAAITAIVAIFDQAQFIPSLHPVFEGIAIVVIYFVMNQLMDFFLTPYLLSKTTKMHPILMIAVVILGTSFLGMFGTILAVPVVLVIQTILAYYRDA